MLGVDFMFCKKKKNSMVIGTVAGIGVVAAVTAVAFKVRGMVKEKMASEFDEMCIRDSSSSIASTSATSYCAASALNTSLIIFFPHWMIF